MDMKNIEDFYPLSPMQQGMLFHSLYAPESGVYVEQVRCTLHGNVNAIAFEQAWQRVVDRHAILRTAFIGEGLKEPVQVVHRQVRVNLEQNDWRDLPAAQQPAQLADLLQAEQRRGLQLAEPPLLRLILIRIAENAYSFVWTFHHILLDGWSVPLLFGEVLACYEAFQQGHDLQLEPARPYKDYIVWLRRQNLDAAADFWRRTLAGFGAPTPLGVDHPPAGAPGYAEQEIRLSSATTAQLQALVRQHQLTLNTLVQGAWALLLSRYSGETDIVFGSTVSGRPGDLTGVERMIGLFINTLPIRVLVSPDAPLLSWLTELQSQQAEVRQYEYTPLVQVQGWSDVPRDLPLFESILVFENYPIDQSLSENESSLDIRDIRFIEQTNYPLTVAFGPGQELVMNIAYDCQRFDTATIERMLDHMRIILESIVDNPQQRLKHIQLMSSAEQQKLLLDWNNTTTPYPHDQCLHHLIEQQVERTPDAPALVAHEEQLSYNELNARANQLAHYLRKSGVGPDVLVGLCLERSPALIVALLAILKAGGAYVPLDPAVPVQRLAFTLQDAQVRILITRQDLLETRPELTTWEPGAGSPPTVVALDSEAQRIAQEPTSNPASPTTPDQLAYVIYTSGSTGQPKGVAVHHRAVVNHNVAVASLFELAPGDRMLQFATLAFDAAVEEIFPTLQRGATLVLRPGDTLPSVAELQQLIADKQLTVLDLPTAYWHEWVADLERTPTPLPDSLRLVIVGGEAVVAERLRAWQQLVDPRVRWLNTYGPTEATIIASAYEPPAGTLWTQPTVPIGRPIANMRIYLLDARLNPVPVGVPGELYIGGVGVARGYVNRSEVTAEHFIPDPFSNEAGARLYKTGDLARYLPDGTIEFVGRVDDQVKLRGFRVEPGEIAAVLREHTAVRESVVLLRKDTLGNQRLVAYVVPTEDTAPEPAELRAYLQPRLPDYMLPAAFVTLDALPLTPNGKVNRQALPAPDDTGTELAQDSTAPRTPVEEILAGLWAQVLGTDRVGIHSNFFALGGHSLLATRLISRLRQAFQVELPLRAIFEAPTVAELALRIEMARRSSEALAPPIAPAHRDGNLPLSFGQQRLWFLAQLEPDNPFYNMPAALRFRGYLDIPALVTSLEHLIQRHEVLRTTFTVVDGQPVQVVVPPAPLLVPVTDLRHLPPAEREATAHQTALAEAQQPFDLTQGPLLRVHLLHLAPDDYVALFTMHHIVADGWSIDVLMHEIAALYTAARAGETAALPDLTIQYADFAVWQRGWLQGAVLEQHVAYWQQQLQGVPPLLELPTDYPRPAVQTANGATYPIRLPASLADGLRRLSQQNGCTLFMTLLAAFQVLLARYSGQSDICVGTPIANRTRAELEPLIGFFVNTLVLRSDLSDNPTFHALLQQVREVTLGAYAHQDVPFELLVEALQPVRSLSHSPLFQVMFTLENTVLAAQELPDLTLEPVSIESGTAKFDLTLSLVDAPGDLEGQIEYNTDLFDAATIARMAGHFEMLLIGIVAHPDQPVAGLPLLTETERQQLLVEWNATSTPYPRDQIIPHLFEARVAQTPDAVALVFAGRQMTYQELNTRANQLAHYLQHLGVGPDTLVGLYMERSLDLIVGLLAILKAGGAYVAFDPTYPTERLAFMLSDTAVPVVLTQQHLVDRLPTTSAHLLCLDQASDWLAQQSSTNPTCRATPTSLAYVSYTSGSTGTPKGVCIPHRAVVRLVRQTSYATLSADEVFLQLAPIPFDASTLEIWGSLLNGARLVIMPPQPPSLADLARVLREEQVSLLWLTAGLFHMMVDEQLESLAQVRQVLAGGDVLSVTHVVRLLQAKAQGTLINGYGPTENTTFSCCYPMTHPTQVGTTVPIGRPIANTRAYILDHALQPVPIGVVGELYVAGDGLARGYLNRPELTAERFLPDPFATEPGAHMYRTGDMVRYLPDGTIEFLGRIDTQVKIRGFRVELGEIEVMLAQHPGVREVVVLAREDTPGDKRLVAYIVPAADTGVAGSELRDWLQDKLPAYMLPAAFVLLEAFPLNPNGKVDRRALPAPEGDNVVRTVEYVPPRNPIEEILVDLGVGILGIEQIGVQDNFFELGGHSLLATQLISRIRDAFQVDIPLRTLFETPTIEALALAITQYSAEQQHDEEMDVLLDELEQLSEDEVQALLAQQTLDQ